MDNSAIKSESLITNLRGRLRNTSLACSQGLFPVFEAVVNSIHSIEELGEENIGKITVEVERLNQGNLSAVAAPGDFIKPEENDIIGFSVKDNGIGFTDENYLSFKTLDSEHKIDKGCRGVGRLLWLKAFSHVLITSTYYSQCSMYSREFKFDAINGVSTISGPSKLPNQNTSRQTCVQLMQFQGRYRKTSSKTLNAIANRLLEHCLWYFVRKETGVEIIVVDGDDSINLNDLYAQYMLTVATSEKVEIKEREFEITHVRFRAHSSKKHSISYCAANRLVKEENINGKVLGLYGKIPDEDGSFIYSCYVTSDFLDERVKSERTSFNIEENIDGILAEIEISLSDTSRSSA